MRALAFLVFLSGCPGGKDEPVDTAADADTDTDSDTDTDTDTDTDLPDAAWAHCPDATAYVGDAAWTARLDVIPGATWCGAANESRTIEQELAAKAMLRLAPSTYAVPHVEGTYDLTLPVCTRFADAAAQPGMAGAGTTEVNPNVFGSTTYSYVSGAQPLATEGGAAFTLNHTLVLVGPTGEVPETLVLDGAPADASTGAGASFVLFEEGTAAYDLTARTFGACGDDGWVRNVHTITFDGGEIALELYLGGDVVITAPSAFARASGTLDGTTFDEDDYFRLVYRPDHHHFGRHFAVILDPPIGDVCALRIEDVDGQAGTTTARVSTAACDLTATGERTVTAEDWAVGG